MAGVPLRFPVSVMPLVQFVFRGPFGLVVRGRVPWWWGSWVRWCGAWSWVCRWWWLSLVVALVGGLVVVGLVFGWVVVVVFVVVGVLRS